MGFMMRLDSSMEIEELNRILNHGRQSCRFCIAASALARHCEATGVSLPREGVSHENAWGVSPLGIRCTAGRMHGCSFDCSRCWHFALNDERQRSERSTGQQVNWPSVGSAGLRTNNGGIFYDK